MDNTLIKSFEYSIDFLNEKFGLQLHYPMEYPNSHSGYLIATGMKEDTAKIARKFLFHCKKYWETIPFEDGAIDVLRNLYLKHDVYIVTSAFLSKSEECIVAKWNFIKKYLPWFDLKKLMYSHAKWKLKGDLFIEDNWSQIEEFEGSRMLFNRPYNKEEKPDIRVYNWLDIEKEVWKLENK